MTESYPVIIYGCCCEKYTPSVYDKYTVGSEWTKRNMNCGDVFIGISVAMVNDQLLKPSQESIDELKSYLSKRKLFKADFSTFGFHLAIDFAEAGPDLYLSSDYEGE